MKTSTQFRETDETQHVSNLGEFMRLRWRWGTGSKGEEAGTRRHGGVWQRERGGGVGGIQAAGEHVPPGGFICPGFRQGLISEQWITLQTRLYVD